VFTSVVLYGGKSSIQKVQLCKLLEFFAVSDRVLIPSTERPLFIAFFLQAFGYSFIRLMFDSATLFRVPLQQNSDMLTISKTGLCLMIMAMCMTGVGATAGLGSGMNSVAKSFPDSLVSLLTHRHGCISSLKPFLESKCHVSDNRWLRLVGVPLFICSPGCFPWRRFCVPCHTCCGNEYTYGDWCFSGASSSRFGQKSTSIPCDPQQTRLVKLELQSGSLACRPGIS
jgi:hypothetical protein